MIILGFFSLVNLRTRFDETLGRISDSKNIGRISRSSAESLNPRPRVSDLRYQTGCSNQPWYIRVCKRMIFIGQMLWRIKNRVSKTMHSSVSRHKLILMKLFLWAAVLRLTQHCCALTRRTDVYCVCNPCYWFIETFRSLP